MSCFQGVYIEWMLQSVIPSVSTVAKKNCPRLAVGMPNYNDLDSFDRLAAFLPKSFGKRVEADKQKDSIDPFLELDGRPGAKSEHASDVDEENSEVESHDPTTTEGSTVKHTVESLRLPVTHEIVLRSHTKVCCMQQLLFLFLFSFPFLSLLDRVCSGP